MGYQFQDRQDAGRQLADRLGAYADRPDVRVVGLARGGIPVAVEVAQALGAPLDILPVRKLHAPGEPEVPIGAVALGGAAVLDPEAIRRRGLAEDEVATAQSAEQPALVAEAQLCPARLSTTDLAGHTVVVVDDALRTGVTVRAALAALAPRQPARVVVAVPVGASETCARLYPAVDEFVCLRPAGFVFAAHLWYEDFTPITDDAVLAALAQVEEPDGAAASADACVGPARVPPAPLSFDYLTAGLPYGVKLLARRIMESALEASLLAYFYAYPHTALTAPDLAYQIARPLPAVEEALAALVATRLVVVRGAGDLVFFQLTADPQQLCYLTQLAAWQETWIAHTEDLLRLIGLPLVGSPRMLLSGERHATLLTGGAEGSLAALRN